MAVVDRDALGGVLLANRGTWPRGPGTWTLGTGVVGAPGLGIGGTLRFVHPDLGWTDTHLQTMWTLTSTGAGSAQVHLRTEGRWWWLAHLSGSHAWVPEWTQDTYLGSAEVWTGAFGLAPGFALGRWAAWAGGLARIDWTPDQQHGHGPMGGMRWDGRTKGQGWLATVTGSGTWLDYRHTELGVDLRGFKGLGNSTVGMWLRTQAALVPRAPAFRLPSAGGGTILRHPSHGRLRGDLLTTGVLEGRVPLSRMVGVVVFAEAAQLNQWHGGGGGGLRLHLPPQPHNTVRLDAAVGDLGWGIVAGWGEQF